MVQFWSLDGSDTSAARALRNMGVRSAAPGLLRTGASPSRHCGAHPRTVGS